MNGLAYKRHLLNYMTYTHQYLAESNKELAQTDKTALCEMASHCMGILWVLADDIASDEFDRLELIEALDGLANRWVRAVEKWGRDLPHNRFAAYTAPIRERKALGQWPDPSSAPPKHDDGDPHDAPLHIVHRKDLPCVHHREPGSPCRPILPRISRPSARSSGYPRAMSSS